MPSLVPLLRGSLCLSLALAGCSAPRSPPDLVVLVTIDTLRADHLELYGYLRSTAPFLEALADDGVVFDNVTTPVSHTAPSHASIMTGLYPYQHGLLSNGMTLNENIVTLASVFRRNGYRTAAFTPTRFLRELGSGFEHLESRSVSTAKGRVDSALQMFDLALDWLAQPSENGKDFVWVHLFDVHEYKSASRSEPSNLWVDDSDADRKALEDLLFGEGSTYTAPRKRILDRIDSYDSQIRFVDKQLRRFYEQLSASGRNGNALWVITSDHGEGLGAHGIYGHGGKIYNEQLKVPLLFHSTGLDLRSGRREQLVELLDVAPTLAELIGDSFELQIVPTHGRSLVKMLEEGFDGSTVEVAFAQRQPWFEGRMRETEERGEVLSLQTPHFKLITHEEGDDEFFDLDRDPAEANDLAGRGIPEEASFRTRLLELRDRLLADGQKVESGFNPEHADELRALGYLD